MTDNFLSSMIDQVSKKMIKDGEPISIQNKFQTLRALETRRNARDESEQPNYVFDTSSDDEWIKEEAAVDRGAIECVISRKRWLHF